MADGLECSLDVIRSPTQADSSTNMRSKQLNLSAYDTDKIKHHYLELYDPILSPWIDSELKLLEIGIHRGGSLKLWRDYFPHGRIVGIDLKLPKNFFPGERVQVFEGSQADTGFLSEVAMKTAPEGFDLIIDDASHIGELTKTTFWHLFDRHLKPGGLYAIEDWGTGYLDDFPDGKKFDPKPSALDPFPCHSHGMVGSPNPVPASEGPGKATITWNSVDGKIYVSVNGREEMLFAGSPRGAQEANWIEAGSHYEFRLYNAQHKELLAKVIVTKATQ